MTRPTITSPRGQSEVLGTVLLLGLVLTIAVAVAGTGQHVMDDVETTTELEDAEQSMTDLQSSIDLADEADQNGRQITFGATDAARESVGGGPARDDLHVDENAGHVTVQVKDASDADGWESVADHELGSVTYTREDRKVTYQAGGVFRKTERSDSSVVVAPPDVKYQYQNGPPTLQMNVIEVEVPGGARSESSPDSTLSIADRGSTQRFAETDIGNPIQSGDSLKITVRSEYYQAWGDYFDQLSGAEVTIDHGNDEVTVVFQGPLPELPTVDGPITASLPSHNPAFFMGHRAEVTTYNSEPGVAATTTPTTSIKGKYDWSSGASAGMGQIDGDLVVEERLEASGDSNTKQIGVTGRTIVGGTPGDGKPAYVDCKGCSFGDNLPSDTDAMHVNDDLELSGKDSDKRLVVHGDVYVEGDVEELEYVEIEGDLHVNGDMKAKTDNVDVDDVYVDGDNPHGWDDEGQARPPKEPEISDRPPVSHIIDRRGSIWSGNNDNPGDGTVDDFEAAGGCTSTCTLEAGNYYLDSMTADQNEEIVFDTSEGPVNLYVENGVTVSGGTVKVQGDHPVRVFNNGDMQFESGQIDTEPVDKHAPAFWVYMHPDEDAVIEDDGFVGVLYAPGEDDDGVVDVQSNKVDIHGAIVAQMEGNVPKHTVVHFDEALLNSSPEPTDRVSPDDDVTYVAVKDTTIAVGDA